MVWKPWRLQQARFLIPLGFTDFQINGTGDTVATMSLTVHDIPVNVSYIIDRKELRLSIDDRTFAHMTLDDVLHDQADVIDKVMDAMIDCDMVTVTKKE